MNIFITLAILLANAIAITLVYQFVKGLPKMEKIIFIGVSFAIMYVLVSISYWISGFGIRENVNEALKNFIIYIFVPVNIIILIPFVARKYYKWRQNEIGKESLITRIIIVSIIGVLILAVETIYIKEIKKDIDELAKPAVLTEEKQNEAPIPPMENTVTNEEIQKREEYNNSLKTINNKISETIENNIAINEQEY
ncbi:MAG: hypothetical protein HFJ41_05190 [Clostridia bacterium]|nr:hypothetical protein [Clostridia bacterium]